MTDYYWHFCPVDNEGVPRLGHGDGREVRVGETLTVDGVIELCEHGLHACERILDALKYVSSRSALCRVTLGGTIVHDIDKYVAAERTVVAMLSAEETDALLREFARWCALQVSDLWDAPQVVRDYLETGDESIREAASAAASAAARDASAWDAASAAAKAAARAAARDAAARDVAAWDAASAAARDAAAWDAASAAASAAAAWDAARAAQNEWLTAAALRRMEAQP
jgi:hypothetical protein